MNQRRDDERAHKYAFTPYPLVTTDSVAGTQVNWEAVTSTDEPLDRESYMLDIDRMVNEGLGGGQVTEDNGYIGDSTTDSMKPEPHDVEGENDPL